MLVAGSLRQHLSSTRDSVTHRPLWPRCQRHRLSRRSCPRPVLGHAPGAEPFCRFLQLPFEAHGSLCVFCPAPLGQLAELASPRQPPRLRPRSGLHGVLWMGWAGRGIPPSHVVGRGAEQGHCSFLPALLSLSPSLPRCLRDMDVQSDVVDEVAIATTLCAHIPAL